MWCKEAVDIQSRLTVMVSSEILNKLYGNASDFFLPDSTNRIRFAF